MANFVNNSITMNDFSTYFKNFILNVMTPMTQDVFSMLSKLNEKDFFLKINKNKKRNLLNLRMEVILYRH